MHRKPPRGHVRVRYLSRGFANGLRVQTMAAFMRRKDAHACARRIPPRGGFIDDARAPATILDTLSASDTERLRAHCLELCAVSSCQGVSDYSMRGCLCARAIGRWFRAREDA